MAKRFGHLDGSALATIWKRVTKARTPLVLESEFQAALETHALFFRALTIKNPDRPQPPPPSERARKLARLEGLLASLNEALPTNSAGEWRYESLRGAAEALADQRRAVVPPGVTPKRHELPLVRDAPPGDVTWTDIWPLDEAYQSALDHISWLAAVAKHARERTDQDKLGHGQPVEDEATYNLCASLSDLFEKVTGIAPALARVEFTDFVDDVFSALGVDATRKAIEATVRRHMSSS